MNPDRPKGSSPLSRGIRTEQLASMEIAGIIPALAGNTLGLDCEIGAIQDHPRSRGEYRSPLFPTCHPRGSSPLSRGILLPRLRHEFNQGIIPALAGNTVTSRRKCFSRQDHPRSRGEYRVDLHTTTHSGGSSPLSRGIRNNLPRGTAAYWIIPALAGNTTYRSHNRTTGTDHPRSRGEYASSFATPPL